MFIRFNVSNFLSFNEMQEFSLIGGKVRSNSNRVVQDDISKILKFGAIYGANASGKSNLISAIDFMKNTVIDGFPRGHSKKYFKVDKDCKDKKSYFEIEMKLENKYYSYGFECMLNKSSFVSEWLVQLDKNGHDKEIFSRNISDGVYESGNFFKDDFTTNKLSSYGNDLKKDSNTLLLRFMNQFKSDFYVENEGLSVLKKVYNWIEKGLDINYPDRPITNYSYFMLEDGVDEISRIIRAFGTGIQGFKIVDYDLQSKLNDIPTEVIDDILDKMEKIRVDEKAAGASYMLRSDKNDFVIVEMDRNGAISSKTIKFNHGNCDELFDFREESDGTVRLLDLLEVLLDKSGNKTYFIDEIDRCLHPQLTYKFIEEFLKLAEKRDIQLIVTTHESRLLDFELLRRDEIWFVDKNELAASKVYSLDEYNIRFDQKIDKAYLEGRYGGVPIFNSIFPLGGVQ